MRGAPVYDDSLSSLCPWLTSLRCRISYVSEASHPLVKHHGKKVFELRPKVDWNKGHAVVWLAKYMATTLGCAPDDLVPVYIGDDVSDEDAFTALAKMPQCITVKVWPCTTPGLRHRDSRGVTIRALRVLGVVLRCRQHRRQPEPTSAFVTHRK